MKRETKKSLDPELQGRQVQSKNNEAKRQRAGGAANTRLAFASLSLTASGGQGSLAKRNNAKKELKRTPWQALRAQQGSEERDPPDQGQKAKRCFAKGMEPIAGIALALAEPVVSTEVEKAPLKQNKTHQ
jgi:hypothetical protein